MSGFDYAWAAGFFDGEGHIEFRQVSRSPSRRGYRPPWVLRVHVANTHLPSLVLLKQIFGGGFVSEKPVYKAYHKRSFYWSATSRTAETALRAMLPYLVTKKEQATCAVQACEIRRTSPRPDQHARLSDDTHAQLADLAAKVRSFSARPSHANHYVNPEAVTLDATPANGTGTRQLP